MEGTRAELVIDPGIRWGIVLALASPGLVLGLLLTFGLISTLVQLTITGLIVIVGAVLISRRLDTNEFIHGFLAGTFLVVAELIVILSQWETFLLNQGVEDGRSFGFRTVVFGLLTAFVAGAVMGLGSSMIVWETD